MTTIRHLDGAAELDACVAMQHAIWGPGFREAVPRTILLIAQKMGGVVAGAFDGDRMLGFVFGLTGVRNGTVAHWSDMLAVDPAFRDLGVGRALKAFQRDAVVALGVREMYWTYDPLIARNAHFNLNRLGAEVDDYVIDMYGTTGSTLHGGLQTDRFVVRWQLDAPPPVAPPRRPDDRFVQIPASDGGITAEWRLKTRVAFTEAHADGYRVGGFERAGEAAAYRLGRIR